MPERRAKPLSIKSKLTILIFSVALVTLVVSAVITAYLDIRNFQKAKHAEAQSIVNAMAMDFVRLLSLGDVDVASDIVSHLEAFSEVKSFVVYNKRGQAFFRSGSHTIGQTNPASSFETLFTESMRLSLPIMYKGERYGDVAMTLSTTSLKEDIQRQLFISSLIFLFTLVISFVLAVLLQRRFTDPIVRLSSLVEQVTRKHQQHSLTDNSVTDELEILHQGIEHMLADVERKSQEVKRERDRLNTTLESLIDGVITTDHLGKITYLNSVAERLTGIKGDDAHGKRLIEVCSLINDKTNLPYDGFLEKCLARGIVSYEYDNISLIDPDKRHIPVQISASPIYSENKITGSAIVFRNVTEHRELSNKLSYQARHDSLTGLINRHEFEQRLNDSIVTAGNERQHVFLYIDLDQFKVVNDLSGHIAGDTLLKQVAVFLSNNVRNSDIVARFGGDEFGILLYDCHTEKAVNIADNIIADISEFTFVWEENTFKIGASIGLVVIASHSVTVTDILRDADIACYSAKDLGRNRIHIHEEQDSVVSQRQGELYWISRLNDAIKDDSFILYLQRIAPINDNVDAQKYEVLLRLKGSEDEIINPGAFLPAAERYGMIDYIDRWVIENLLCHKSFKHILMENPNAQFNINLSGKSLSDEKLAPFILDMFRRFDVYPKSICFEITETAAIANFSEAIEFTQSLRAVGSEIALDDFGSGLSSFAYLKNLPVDYLKLDGSFIRDIENSPMNYAMVRSINELGQIMGIRTVAECVENAEALAHLRKIGINFAQGYHIHKPEPLTKVAKDDKVVAISQWRN